jgi:hypothetical protein
MGTSLKPYKGPSNTRLRARRLTNRVKSEARNVYDKKAKRAEPSPMQTARGSEKFGRRAARQKTVDLNAGGRKMQLGSAYIGGAGGLVAGTTGGLAYNSKEIKANKAEARRLWGENRKLTNQKKQEIGKARYSRPHLITDLHTPVARQVAREAKKGKDATQPKYKYKLLSGKTMTAAGGVGAGLGIANANNAKKDSKAWVDRAQKKNVKLKSELSKSYSAFGVDHG